MNTRKRRDPYLSTMMLLSVVLILAAGALILALWQAAMPEEAPIRAPGYSSSGAGLDAEPGWETEDADVDLTMFPRPLQELYEKNEEARDFVLGWYQGRDAAEDIDLSDLTGCQEPPLLFQWDQRWGYAQYAGNFLALSGCGPTVLSMAAIYLTGDTDWTPLAVARYAEENGYAVMGNGTKWTLFSQGAEGLGLTATELPLSESSIARHLEDGELVACIMGPGDFTTSGHYILFTGVTSDGSFTVNDSNSAANSAKTWRYADIKGQIRNLWALSAA